VGFYVSKISPQNDVPAVEIVRLRNKYLHEISKVECSQFISTDKNIRHSFNPTAKQQQQLQQAHAVSLQQAASAQSNGLHLADRSQQKKTQRHAFV